MQELIKKHADKFRFILVGLINTAIDFGIYFSLVHSFGPTSNLISTTIAFVFSFFANKHYTFKSTGNAKHEIPRFIIVTLFGLWVIQSLIISATNALLINSAFNVDLDILGLSINSVVITGKIIATCVTLVWNYILYSHFVFKYKKD